ncbi:MAG: hypothetical protein PVI26_12730, partial [Chitinispirillia bacterium]
NATIIISSHQLDAIEKLCTSIGILENGKLKIIDIKNLKQNQSRRTWFIRSNYKREYQQIIENISGELPVYNNGKWIFTVSEDQSEKVIPAIISNLSSNGCLIYEVKPEEEDFRKSIRHHIDMDE